MISPKTVTQDIPRLVSKDPTIRKKERKRNDRNQNQKQPPAPVLKFPQSINLPHPKAKNKTSPRPFVSTPKTIVQSIPSIPKPNPAKPLTIIPLQKRTQSAQTLTSPGSSITPSIQPLPAGITAPEIPLSSIAMPSPSPRSTYFWRYKSSQIRWKYKRRVRRPRR